MLSLNLINDNLIFMKHQQLVPPKWKVEPMDISVERNKHIMLHCQADGVPTPVVVWKKSIGNFHP